jgi:hypothetical protein
MQGNHKKIISEKEVEKTIKKIYIKSIIDKSLKLIQEGIKSLQKSQEEDFFGTDDFYLSFLFLSRGYELLMKVMIVLKNYDEKNSYPTNKEMKAFGHDLNKLRENIGKNYELLSENKFKRFPELKHDQEYMSKNVLIEIIKIISEYGKCDRYFELDYITSNTNLDKITKKGSSGFKLKKILMDRISKDKKLSIMFQQNPNETFIKCMNLYIIPILKKFTGALTRQFSLNCLGEEAMCIIADIDKYSFSKDYKVKGTQE